MGARSLLVTRSAEGAGRFAEAAAARGWTPLFWPLLRIAPVGAPVEPGDAQAVLLTSANAARRVRPAPLPALCVGEATAAAARRAGFADVRCAAGDAASLAALARARLSPDAGPLLFARGEHVAADLAGALRAAGFAVREAVVYRADPAGPPPAALARRLAAGEVAAAAFFSARAAAAFAARAPEFGGGLRATAAAAISGRAAAPLRNLAFRALRLAARPEGGALLDALDEADAAK